MQPPSERRRAHAVGPGRGFVDDDVVRVAPAAVEGVGGEGLGRVLDGAQLAQIHHLHAVPPGLRHNERVVVVDLDVPPQRIGRGRGQVRHHHRVQRVGDVDEGGAVGAAQDHVLRAVGRVHPAPDVVHPSATNLARAHDGHQLHVLTREVPGKAIDAGGLGCCGGSDPPQHHHQVPILQHGAKVRVGPGRHTFAEDEDRTWHAQKSPARLCRASEVGG